VAETELTASEVVDKLLTPDNCANDKCTNGATTLLTIGVLITAKVLPAYAVFISIVVPNTFMRDAVRAGKSDRGPLDSNPTAVKAAADREGVANAVICEEENALRGDTGLKAIPTSLVERVRIVTPLEVRVVPTRFGFPVFSAERREVVNV
jgi:hypothetical protein